MQPYNDEENDWLSKTKQKIINHYREYEPVYAALAGIMLIMLLVLSVLTAVDSFYEIVN
jgi:hypothetical protein